MNQKQIYDDLIFNRYQGEYAKNQINPNYEQLADHLKERFQLDFYPGDWQVTNDHDQLILSTKKSIDDDFISYQNKPDSVNPAHIKILQPKIKLPLLSQEQLSPQTIYLVLTTAQNTMHPHNNHSRLERILKDLHQLIDYTPMIQQVNRMYQQTIIKQTIILDSGLSTAPLTAKGLSYLKTNFREFYDIDHDRLFVTNSRADLGAKNLAITPFETNEHKLSAKSFAEIINSEELTAAKIQAVNGLSFDLTQIGYQKVKYHKDKQKVQWLSDLNKTVESATSTTPSPNPSHPQTNTKINSTKPRVKPKSTKPAIKDDQPVTKPKTETGFYPKNNHDLMDYHSARSVTDVINSHTNHSRIWSNEVIISHIDDEK